MSDAANKAFVEAVWNKASKDGWPVNAGDIRIFGGGDEVEKASIRNVVKECTQLGYLSATMDGDIHRLTPAGKAYIGVE